MAKTAYDEVEGLPGKAREGGRRSSSAFAAKMGPLKTCPVCGTTLFGDMEVCYGCMYRFGSNPDLERRACGGPSCASKVEGAKGEARGGGVAREGRAGEAGDRRGEVAEVGACENGDAESGTSGSGLGEASACVGELERGGACSGAAAGGSEREGEGGAEGWVMRIEVRDAEGLCQAWSVELPCRKVE